MKKELIISGPKGSGKSKLASTITGFFEPDQVIVTTYSDMLRWVKHHKYGVKVIIVGDCVDLLDIYSLSIDLEGNRPPEAVIIYLTQQKIELDDKLSLRFKLVELSMEGIKA